MHTESFSPRLVLYAATAADLMTQNPVSVSAGAPVRDAIAFLVQNGLSGAPVIDEAGRPVGVLSRSDILAHSWEAAGVRPPAPRPGRDTPAPGDGGLTVRDIMTPAVFTISPDTPAERVVREMVSLNVRRLFVADRDGVLVGVISAPDVLRHLRAEALPARVAGYTGCEPS